MKIKLIKKCFALLLVMLMIISSLPLSVFAEEAIENTVVTTGEEVPVETVTETEKTEATTKTEESQTESAEDSEANAGEATVQDEASEEPVLTTAVETTSDGTYMYNVPYVDVDAQGNKTTKICEKARILTSDFNDTVTQEYALLNEEWYVTSEISRFSLAIRTSGNVHMILIDGVTFNSTGGIDVNHGHFTIYGQAKQTGTLSISVQNGTGMSGICVENENSFLTINGGIVYAEASNGGAGIGGSDKESGMNITINGGKVTAISTQGGAGIGGGRRYGQGKNITINGGTVRAYGADGWTDYSGGAGIGGGEDSTGENITINGGTVYAYGKGGGAGIGGGESGKGSNIAVNGGTVYAEGSLGGAGIGGGYDRQGESITINNNANVTAIGAVGGAGIGGGDGCDGKSIHISSSTVDAKATGTGGAGIGGGNKGSGSDVTISNTANVTATGADGGAGIGGGDNGHGQSISISGSTVTAYGSKNAAGIGGGYLGTGSGITITDATITADGGYAGAGIGGGYSAHGQNISISGSTVKACAGLYAAAIGGGYKGNGSGITITGNDIEAEAGAFFDDNNAVGGGKEGSASGIYVNCYLAVQTQKTSETYASDITLPKSGDLSALLTGKYYLHMVRLPEITYLDFENGSYVEKTVKDYRTITTDTTELTDDIYVLTQDVTMDHSLKITGDMKLILIDKHVLKIAGVADGEAGILVTNTDLASPENKLTICDDGSTGAGIEVTGGQNAAGIGGGENQNGSAITINGGTVTANGGTNGAGIGGGSKGTGDFITINGGVVTATGGNGGAGIGGGYGRHGNEIAINGGTVTATGGTGGAGIGGGNGDGGFDIAINGGIVTAKSGGENTSAIGGGKLSGSSGITVSTSCVVRADDQDPPQTIVENTGEDLWEALHYKPYASVRECVDTDYLDAQGQAQHVMATPLSGTMTTLEEGWYVVNKSIAFRRQLKISGEVHLILADDCTLRIISSSGQAALEVTNDNTEDLKNNLTIYGQTGGTGALRAFGGNNGAGIGGSENENGSGITINGGTILATGGNYGAGIGGGRGGNGSDITINGGTITATGGHFSAGIGGGFYGAAANIVVNNGMVQATGTDLGAGIGGGYHGTGSQITINGGNVNATGGTDGGAGIGGGNRGEGSNITLNDGEIIATGGKNAAGIGGGSKGKGSDIAIGGGVITATGGKNASAIGGGNNGSGADIVFASFLAIHAGDDSHTAAVLLNDGTDLSDTLSDKAYVQAASLITVENDQVLVYDQDAEQSVVLATAPASVYYNGKTQAASVLKAAYLSDTYDSILTKSDDYQNKADVTTPLTDLANRIKRIYTSVDGTAKTLLGTRSAEQLKTAIKTITAGISSFKGSYYGNLATDLAAAISLNNGDFCTDENAAIIDKALRTLYVADPDGKSVITGEITASYGDAFYTALLTLGEKYLQDDTLSKDLFTLYEGGEAYAVNFNSETIEDRTVFNEAAYNTYESGYLLVNTAIAYDLRNHQNQLNAINALQAAALSNHFTESEQAAIKNEMTDLETTLGISLDEAKKQHEASISADLEKIDALNAQYSNIRSAWQASEENLQKDRNNLAADIVLCYRNGNSYNRVLKVADVNDGVPNASSVNAADFLIQTAGIYQAQVQPIYLEDDRSRTNTAFTDAASVSDLANLHSWANDRKTTLNAELAKAFVTEGSEDLTTQADETTLGIYANGTQSATQKGNLVTFTRSVTYIQDGSWEDKDTMTRQWRAADGALQTATTDIDSQVLVLSNAELGGGDDDDTTTATGNANTGISGGNFATTILPIICVIAAGFICVILIDRKKKGNRL